MFFPRLFLLPIVASFVCVAPVVAAEDSPYIQLKEGAEWTMDAKLMSPKAGVLPAVGRRVIESGVEKDGKKYLRERTWLEVKGEKVTGYSKLVRKDPAGFYSIQEDQEGATEQCEIVLPLKAGQSWEFLSKGKTMKCTVIGLETVTVGDKTYENCFHLRTAEAGGAFTEDFWESPNEGNVKSELVFGNGGKLTVTLKEFKPGK
ncbi:MAG TPA: hypothetical protein VK961_21565 [Chthoniobacter sp.]|nr:hypothetical protein [Chthoniobacter sp.]